MKYSTSPDRMRTLMLKTQTQVVLRAVRKQVWIVFKVMQHIYFNYQVTSLLQTIQK